MTSTFMTSTKKSVLSIMLATYKSLQVLLVTFPNEYDGWSNPCWSNPGAASDLINDMSNTLGICQCNNVLNFQSSKLPQ